MVFKSRQVDTIPKYAQSDPRAIGMASKNYRGQEESRSSITKLTKSDINKGQNRIKQPVKRKKTRSRKRNAIRDDFRRSILENPEKLQQLYEDKSMSDRQIANKLGCSHTTVRRARKFYGITGRTKPEAALIRWNNDVPLTELLEEMMQGTMLGDGTIRSGIENSLYQITSKHREYINHVKSLFEKSNYETKTSKLLVRIKKGKTPIYYLYTCSTIQLHQIRVKWYPDGIKRVPEDLHLTPTTCLYWYLEDGSLYRTFLKKTRVMGITGIKLSTYDFSREENEMLVKKLQRVLDIYEGIKLDSGNYIRMNKLPGELFLNYIGNKSPVICFNYKFDPNLKIPKKIQEYLKEVKILQ
ncbi:MAG: hypothetical protein ACXAEU_10565 [Candidatus Hodarchaeales archaeon]